MILYNHINWLGLKDMYIWVMENNTGKFNPYHNNFHLENDKANWYSPITLSIVNDAKKIYKIN
jgi:hypothetical protein